MNKAVVSGVVTDSIADETGIEAGDIIVSVNGHPIEDELDFRFYAACEYLELLIKKHDGSELIEIENPDIEDIGVLFESALFGNAKRCSNNCIFCFIDQLPPGMRDSLYFKDDDSRLSFLTGNYITLTNASDRDIDKIIKMRLEPVNVSVHTTNAQLRIKMLKNPKSGQVLEHMRRLADGKIHMNCQIVLVKGVNDGAELDRTISELSALHPYVTSVSVVPVGITKYRDGLYPLKPFGKHDSEKLLEQINARQEKLLAEIGTRFIYASDEFYLKAETPVPPHECYEGYCQIENGVGLMRSFRDEFEESLPLQPERSCHAGIITGMAAHEEIISLAKKAMKRYNNVKIDVFPIRNDFFGESITVAGLVTGGDILAQLKGMNMPERMLIPETMLRKETELFLDDVTVTRLEGELGVKIEIVPCRGDELWKSIIRA